jgi:hypothetical protein
LTIYAVNDFGATLVGLHGDAARGAKNAQSGKP